jgi:hypothetical protein
LVRRDATLGVGPVSDRPLEKEASRRLAHVSVNNHAEDFAPMAALALQELVAR